MKFEKLNLDKKLLRAIDDMGYERCTPVQEQTFPESLTGRDVSVQAQTGTGKTAVFLVTSLQRMISQIDLGGKLRVLILVPTRELAVQVEKQAKLLCSHVSYRALSMYGGVGYDRQERAVRDGVEIIVATPGRLIDFIKSKKLDLSTVRYMIIDEADRMMDMGFMPDVRYILKKAPPKEKRHTMIFSATLDSRIRRLAGQYMTDPAEIEIEPNQVTVENVRQTLFHVSREEKIPAILWLVKREHITKGLIFTNMKRTAEQVGFKMDGNGIEGVAVITGDIDQRKRLRIIDGFQTGKVRILVATDVAARGLHIDNITHVINYDLPEDAANYVHRIGRTARAGAKGVAYTLACEDLVENLPSLERFIGQKIDVGMLDERLPKDEAGYYRSARRSAPTGRGGGRARGGVSSAPADRKRPAQMRETSGAADRGKAPSKKPYSKTGFKKSDARPAATKKTGSATRKKTMSHAERMEHYKKKYGESFKAKSGAKSGSKTAAKTGAKSAVKSGAAKKKKGFFSKIVGRLRKR